MTIPFYSMIQSRREEILKMAATFTGNKISILLEDILKNQILLYDQACKLMNNNTTYNEA